MRKFVKSIRKVFRRNNADDKEKEEDKAEVDVEPKEQKKFPLSCSRKKKKKKGGEEVANENQQPVKKVDESTKTSARLSVQQPKPPPEKQQSSTSTSKMSATSPAMSIMAEKTQQQSVRTAPKSTMPAIPKSTSTAPPTNNSSRGAAPTSVRGGAPQGVVRLQRRSPKDSTYVPNVPKSESTPSQMNSVAVRSKSAPDLSSSGEGTGTLKRFKEFSARTLRKVKTFVSRPIREATLHKVAERVKTRKRHEEPEKLKHGEDCFPKMQRRDAATPRKRCSAAETFPQVQSTYQQLTPGYEQNRGTGTTGLVKNKDNNGNLFIEKGGKKDPFWTKTRRPTEEDLEDSTTDDELQLNADVVLEVLNGTTKLVNMPSIPVVLDPYNEITDLQKRNQLFFNRDVLFGNTVRTMINLSDQTSIKSVRKKPRERGKPLAFEEPTTMKTYANGDWKTFATKKFEPTAN